MIRVREGFDGTFWIPREDVDTEAYLDNIYLRVPGTLTWTPKELPNFKASVNKYKGKVAYIVGKGPSLDLLSAKHFGEDGIIIAINDAVNVVKKLNVGKPLYGMQLDVPKPGIIVPKDVPLIIGQNNASIFVDRKDAIVVNRVALGMDGKNSGYIAIYVARHFGCITVNMLCFDGALGGDTNYAKVLGTKSSDGGPQDRFLKHKAEMLDAAKNIPCRWLIPINDTEIKTIDSLA